MSNVLKVIVFILATITSLSIIYTAEYYKLSFSLGVIFASCVYELLAWLKPQPIAIVFKVPEPSKN